MKEHKTICCCDKCADPNQYCPGDTQACHFIKCTKCGAEDSTSEGEALLNAPCKGNNWIKENDAYMLMERVLLHNYTLKHNNERRCDGVELEVEIEYDNIKVQYMDHYALSIIQIQFGEKYYNVDTLSHEGYRFYTLFKPVLVQLGIT